MSTEGSWSKRGAGDPERLGGRSDRSSIGIKPCVSNYLINDCYYSFIDPSGEWKAPKNAARDSQSEISVRT